MRDQQKRYEETVVSAFLDSLAPEAWNLRIRDKDSPPDATATITRDGKAVEVAIEHTDYFNDVESGEESPISQIALLWEWTVQYLAEYANRASHVLDVGCIVWFKEAKREKPRGKKEGKRIAQALAENLARLLEHHRPEPGERCRVHCSEFGDTIPAASRFIRQVLIHPPPIPGFSVNNWHCSNLTTGCCGLLLPNLLSCIRAKSEDAKAYDWPSTHERWLLITASRNTVAQSAGGPVQNIDWANEGLLGVCRDSSFDLVYFFEYVPAWHRLIWAATHMDSR